MPVTILQTGEPAAVAAAPVATLAEPPMQPPAPVRRKTVDVMAPSGRRYTVRRLNPLDRMRAFKAVGAELTQNSGYLSYALLACSISAIDGTPEAMPASGREIEALVGRIGEDWDAINEQVADAFAEPEADLDAVKN